jgi:hypothetical protein
VLCRQLRREACALAPRTQTPHLQVSASASSHSCVAHGLVEACPLVSLVFVACHLFLARALSANRECNGGNRTSLARRYARSRGWRKSQVSGHGRRKTKVRSERLGQYRFAIDVKTRDKRSIILSLKGVWDLAASHTTSETQRIDRRQSASRMGHTQVSVLQTMITLTDRLARHGGSP